MELRPELRPPLLDESLVNHLAELADNSMGLRLGSGMSGSVSSIDLPKQIYLLNTSREYMAVSAT